MRKSKERIEVKVGGTYSIPTYEDPYRGFNLEEITVERIDKVTDNVYGRTKDGNSCMVGLAKLQEQGSVVSVPDQGREGTQAVHKQTPDEFRDRMDDIHGPGT